ncbi:hypothetical protein LDENG_00184650 [Lucifuga dentata]|nr:hypothetical protein LDENG_00184650 [Lucifuga dentata]
MKTEMRPHNCYFLQSLPVEALLADENSRSGESDSPGAVRSYWGQRARTADGPDGSFRCIIRFSRNTTVVNPSHRLCSAQDHFLDCVTMRKSHGKHNTHISHSVLPARAHQNTQRFQPEKQAFSVAFSGFSTRDCFTVEGGNF